MNLFQDLVTWVKGLFHKAVAQAPAPVVSTPVVAPATAAVPAIAAPQATPALVTQAAPEAVFSSAQKGGSVSKGARGGNVRQDSDYVSVIDSARVDAFLKQFGKPPIANRAAYDVASAFPHPRTPESKSIAQDMPLAPAVYGFADKQAVDGWFEKALDTPA